MYYTYMFTYDFGLVLLKYIYIEIHTHTHPNYIVFFFVTFGEIGIYGFALVLRISYVNLLVLFTNIIQIVRIFVWFV